MSKTAHFILRAGVAFAFIYPPIAAWLAPNDWIGYFPAYLRGVVPDPALLHGFGALELSIALWLLSGWRVAWPALAACAILLAIVVLDFAQFDVVFRDLAIAAAAAALAIDTLANRPNGVY